MGRQNWTEAEIAGFVQRLKQVIGWTAKLAGKFDYDNGFYGTVFRQTNPVINGVSLYEFDWDYARWNLDDYDEQLYEKLLGIAVSVRGEQEAPDFTNLAELGRILSFETCCSTHDGAAIAESRCFVDEGDIPPIDTWFYLKRDYYHSEHCCRQALFCWIPKAFEKVMLAAADVEIFDSYRWLDENDMDTYYRIENACRK